jgi:hypothetical protein
LFLEATLPIFAASNVSGCPFPFPLAGFTSAAKIPQRAFLLSNVF